MQGRDSMNSIFLASLNFGKSSDGSRILRLQFTLNKSGRGPPFPKTFAL